MLLGLDLNGLRLLLLRWSGRSSYCRPTSLVRYFCVRGLTDVMGRVLMRYRPGPGRVKLDAGLLLAFIFATYSPPDLL